MRKLAGLMLHGALFSAALGSLLAISSLSSGAQQPANKQSPGPASPPISAATGETIAAEGELRETIRTYQSGNPSAVCAMARTIISRPHQNPAISSTDRMWN
jgi:hypothetical protein